MKTSYLVTKLLGKLVRRFISHATLSLWLLRPIVFPQILFRPLPTKASESRNAFSQIQSSSFLLRINCTLNPKSASLCCFQIVHSVLHCCTLRLFSNHSQRFVPWGCKLLAGAPGHLKGSTHGWCLESCECECIKWIFLDEWYVNYFDVSLLVFMLMLMMMCVYQVSIFRWVIKYFDVSSVMLMLMLVMMCVCTLYIKWAS